MRIQQRHSGIRQSRSRVRTLFKYTVPHSDIYRIRALIGYHQLNIFGSTLWRNQGIAIQVKVPGFIDVPVKVKINNRDKSDTGALSSLFGRIKADVGISDFCRKSQTQNNLSLAYLDDSGRSTGTNEIYKCC